MLNREERRRRRPKSLELTDTALVVLWGDGQQAEYALEGLRKNCPCAACREVRGEPHGPQLMAGNALPMLTEEAAAATAEAVGFDPVGRYGIRLRWADGHDTGIYTFEMLRQQNS
ncbi:MAG: DUF971 domain-containing protein [Gemmatimonadetes bacterium]|jgi:DUF971 family protein|nr:DUF971 domain-containing protein [Gemmatimonadota bacterium]MBT7860380.1 DUF971 domain-containing protein [Gemmatimonadota bacterium]